MHKKIMEIKEMLCEEMIKEAEHGINPGNLEPIYMMAVAAEKIMKMGVLEEELDDGYSERRGYSREGGYSGERYSREGGYSGERYSRDGYSQEGGNSYDGGSSYARRGGQYMRNRYSRDSEMDNMKEKVKRMMEESRNPQEKEAYKRCLEEIEKM